MTSEHTGRNAPCPCGSGKKYKKCCLAKTEGPQPSAEAASLDSQIHDAAMLSLEHNEDAVVEAISRLEALLGDQRLDEAQKRNAKFQLAQAHQRRGQHRTALDLLESSETGSPTPDEPLLESHVTTLKAISLSALGAHQKACGLFDQVLATLADPSADARTVAMVNLEAGKAYKLGGNSLRARECWEATLAYCEGRDDEVEHWARVKANLGFLLLDDPDIRKQEEGIRIVEQSSVLKRQIGDLDGLANNYCQLGLYFAGIGRFERAIAQMRMDLSLSRHVGNLRSTAATLGNLAGIYVKMRQLSKARSALKEAEQIGKDLGDEQAIAIADRGLRHVNRAGREATQNLEIIGPTTQCACGSGEVYQECCGRADFEPVGLLAEFGGISEDVAKITAEMKQAGVEPFRLDFILREPGESATRRYGWCRMTVHDGWLEMGELPDMANYHLLSAKSLADEAKQETDSVAKPLSCILLSVCATEAFINQVAFFLHETQAFREGSLHILPSELSGDVMTFQRSTELTQKWDILGRALCGPSWPLPPRLWTDFRNIVFIRNELVHFKVAEYEQVVPPPPKQHNVIKRVPKSVETKQVPHAWPMRVLTPGVATWCVNVADDMISSFRRGYAHNRRRDK